MEHCKPCKVLSGVQEAANIRFLQTSLDVKKFSTNEILK
jgi:hypothetical protein